jgi:beta-lactamase regulating signal transducer with metallopeptidase domain
LPFIYGLLYYFSRRELKNLVHISGHIYESEHVSMPMVYGMFRSKIILPAKTMENEKNVDYLIAHENTHRRRHDNLWRFLALMVTSVHWFNPMIWICVKRFFEDMELACDEGTIRTMEEEERKQYAYTLLSYAKKDTKLYASSFGGSRIKVRIEHVVTYRNLTLVSILGFSVMFLILVVLLLSNQ